MTLEWCNGARLRAEGRLRSEITPLQHEIGEAVIPTLCIALPDQRWPRESVSDGNWWTGVLIGPPLEANVGSDQPLDLTVTRLAQNHDAFPLGPERSRIRDRERVRGRPVRAWGLPPPQHPAVNGIDHQQASEGSTRFLKAI